MPINIEESDFRSLESFPLKWRWTDSRWNKLPEKALRSIRPLSERRTGELHLYSLEFLTQSGIVEEENKEPLFENIIRVDASSGERAEIRRWLAERSPESNQKAIVSWNDHLAVLVDWAIFCEFWNDFCYPSSDDAAVFPLSEKWMLFYSHDDYFVFGERRIKPII